MCGFIGLLSTSVKRRDNFRQGIAAIQVRGITVDVYDQDNEQFGYARLPTDDIANIGLGQISKEPEKLLFNGLLTNVDYLVEKFRLSAQTAQSDARCLQAGLSTSGVAFLQHVRGMFAAAFITDTTITLMRDTIGIKPLYYAFEDNSFAFASELKALRPLAKTVYEVLPGQVVTFDKSSHTITKRSYRFQGNKHYTADQLEVCLGEAVVNPTKRYLQNCNKPIALLLSGGLDSSVTAQLLVRSLPATYRDRIVAFCIGEDNTPDVKVAKRLADFLKLKLIHVYPYSPEVSFQMLPQIVYKTESPYSRVIKVALLYDALAIAIKQHDIDVVVGGEGADELFFGYQRFIDGLTHKQSEELFHIFFRKIFHYTLLQRYDRIMAQQQIEGRVPYLDQELIQLAESIPPEDKIQYHEHGHTSKLPLRRLAKQLGLPTYIYDREKEKMTAGATGKQNATSKDGYLEQEAIEITGVRFQQLVEILYRVQFGNLLAGNDNVYTEEQAMQLVAQYRAINETKQRERNAI